MIFLDKKEQVIDLQLTSYGKYLLSIGKFNPVQYAFFDDDIIYDKKFVGSGSSGRVEEPQNSIESRIQENTPRMGSQTLYRSAQVATFSENQEHVNNLMPGAVTAAEKESSNFLSINPESSYIFGEPLGNSSFNSNNIAAWNIGFYKAFLTSASGSWVMSNKIPTTFIPQLNCTIKYQADLYPQDENSGAANISKMFSVFAQGIGVNDDESPVVLSDSSLLVLRNDFAFLKIEEANTVFTKDNFEVEVYRVTSKETDKSPEVLERLYFSSDKPTGASEETKLVEYYFDILVDSEINESEYCTLNREREKIENIYIDRIFNCVDVEEILQSLNIYDTEENQDVEACD